MIRYNNKNGCIIINKKKQNKKPKIDNPESNDVLLNLAGDTSLNINTDGLNNMGIGNNSLNSNTIGSNNLAIGHESMQSNSIGENNMGIGNNSLKSNTEGSNNMGIGNNSLNSNTDGLNNMGIGNNSLNSNTKGSKNMGIGENTLMSTTTGFNNLAVGYNALSFVTGSNNIGIGCYTGCPRNIDAVSTSGKSSICGDPTAFDYTTPNNSVFNNTISLGNYATPIIDNEFIIGSRYCSWRGGEIASSASRDNVILAITAPYATLNISNPITNNIRIGDNSMPLPEFIIDNTSHYDNVAIGANSGSFITLSKNGNYNICLGTNAMGSVSNVTDNKFDPIAVVEDIGSITNNSNIAIGDNSLVMPSGDIKISCNIAIGRYALYRNNNSTFNIAIGYHSQGQAPDYTGNTIQNTKFNTSIGFKSLQNNNASNNLAIGHESMQSNSIGENNMGIGNNSLKSNTEGNNNVAIGNNSLTKSTGSNNMGIGANTLMSTTTGVNNLAVGSNALSYVTGSNNIGIGCYTGCPRNIDVYFTSGKSSICGDKTRLDYIPPAETVFNNTISLGNYATPIIDNEFIIGSRYCSWRGGSTASSASRDTVILAITAPYATLNISNPITNNIRIGDNSMPPPEFITSVNPYTSNYDNVAIGANSGSFITLSKNNNYNICLGTNAMGSVSNVTDNKFDPIAVVEDRGSITNDSNIAIGDNSLVMTSEYNKISCNIAIGRYALYRNNNSKFNIAIGYHSQGQAPDYTGKTIQNTKFNTSIGFKSLQNNNASNNLAIGHESMQSNSIGENNMGIGNNSLKSNTEGNNNVAIGINSLNSNTEGSNNLAIGSNALQYNIGSNNLAIGSQSGVSEITTFENTISLGNNAIPISNDEFVIGSAITSPNTVIRTITAPLATLNIHNISGSGIISVPSIIVNGIEVTSDRRDKSDIMNLTNSIETLNKLQPVSYKWNMRKDNKLNGHQTIGFIAQDILEAVKNENDILNLVNTNDTNQYKINPINIIPLLVNSVKEVNQKNIHLTQEIQTLKSELNNIKKLLLKLNIQ